MWQRALAPAADGYTYFPCPQTVYVTVQVLNNGIDIQFRSSSLGAYLPADQYLGPATLTKPIICDEIRFKNHVAGSVAQVDISAQTRDDIPLANPLVGGINPSYLTIDPVTGAVSAVFTGHVKANGVELPTQDVPGPVPATDKAILWKDPGGTVKGWIAVTNTGGVAEPNLYVGNETLAKLLLDKNGGSDWLIKEPQSNLILGTGWSNVGGANEVAKIISYSAKNGKGLAMLTGRIQTTGAGTFIDNSNNYGVKGPLGIQTFLVQSSAGAYIVQVAVNGDIVASTSGAAMNLSLNGINWIPAP